MKKKTKQKINLDQEEKEFLSSFENEEWKPVKNTKKEISSAQKTAHKTLRKDMRA